MNTKASFSFTSVFLNNAVVIIDALAPGDLQTGAALHNALRDLDFGRAAPVLERYPVSSLYEVDALLHEMHARARGGLKPLLHFEGHGSVTHGLRLPKEEWFNWNHLFRRCQSINQATDFNLGVTLAVCYGLHAIVPLKINEPAPFSFLLAPQHSVDAGQIADNLPTFYKNLLVAGQIDEVLAKSFGFTVFLAEKFLVTAYAKYLKRASVGTGRARRIEELVSRSVAASGRPNRALVRKFRQSAKKMTRPTKAEFERYARAFLPGGNRVDFERLLRWVRSGVDE